MTAQTRPDDYMKSAASHGIGKSHNRQAVQLVDRENAWSVISDVLEALSLKVLPMAPDGLLIDVDENVDLMG
jgi:hypothetical protein